MASSVVALNSNNNNNKLVNMTEKNPPICVIRRYRKGDEICIREIITEATMETVGDFFWAAVLSEIFPQVALLIIAIAFIGFGVPFYFCLLGVPVAIVFIYAVIWAGHVFKAMELHEDLNNITQTYMQDPVTGFWVAEVLEVSGVNELTTLVNKAKKVEYEFLTEEELDARGLNLMGQKRQIAGTVAISKSLHGGLK
nr:uncharacterized protein LOC128691449 [Cherax quadricarinatus]